MENHYFLPRLRHKRGPEPPGYALAQTPTQFGRDRVLVLTKNGLARGDPARETLVPQGFLLKFLKKIILKTKENFSRALGGPFL